MKCAQHKIEFYKVRNPPKLRGIAIGRGLAMRTIVDLNCDMGEGFGQWTLSEAPDEDIMSIISSANVATGFHAGDPNSMNNTVRLASEHGVGLGAHPGYNDLQGFGRRTIGARGDELVNDIVYQIGALRAFGRRHGVPLQHVKAHGALYMDMAKDEDFSRQYIDVLQKIGSDLIVFCMGIAVTYGIARDAGQPVVREFYADRDYDRSGSIVFKRQVGRFDPAQLADKCVRACRDGKVKTVEGDDIDIEFESICFHSDTPGALDIGRAVRAALLDEGIKIAPARSVLDHNKGGSA